MTPHFRTRAAGTGDEAQLARIYNEGVEERVATFETRPRHPDEIRHWFGRRFPVVVVEADGRILAWARLSEYSPRPCYAGVGEASVYVARDARGRGAGAAALDALLRASAEAGFHKVVGKIFVENVASRRLVAKAGFREVGVHLRHGQIDGAWHDIVLVEKLLGSPPSAVGQAPKGS